MDPVTLALIAGGANILGGILGGSAASEEADKAMALLNASIERINNLPIPDLTKKIIYENFYATGDFTPQTLNKTIEEYAPLALVIEDPANKLRQQQVYSQIEQASKTGLGPEDLLAMEQAKRKTQRDVLSQMASIESQARQQGRYGAGEDLAAKLMAAQSGADREAMANMQIAASAAANRQAQLQNLFGAASQMRAQDLGVEQENIRAKNLRNELMMKYSTQREAQNKQFAEEQNRRRADLLNQIAQKNVQRSQEEAYRSGYLAPLEMARLQQQKEQMLANLSSSKANVHMGLGGAKAKAWSDIAGGLGSAALGYGALDLQQQQLDALKGLKGTNALEAFNYGSAPKLSTVTGGFGDNIGVSELGNIFS